MGKRFIQEAINDPGALRKTLRIKKGKTIPPDKLRRAASGKGVSLKTAQMARLAETLKRLSKKRKK